MQTTLRTFLVGVLLLLLALPGLAAGERVLARVAGEPLLERDLVSVLALYAPKLDEQLKGARPRDRDRTLAQFRRDTFHLMVTEMILAAEARRLGITVTPAQVRQETNRFVAETKRSMDSSVFKAALAKTGLTEAEWSGIIQRVLERDMLIKRLLVDLSVKTQDEYDLLVTRLTDAAQAEILAPEFRVNQNAQFKEVLPLATSFGTAKLNKDGTPVWAGYRSAGEGKPPELVGYVFYSTEVAPEERAYNGPIKVLIGLDTTATITGIKVISHQEPLLRIVDDFLREPQFVNQFVGRSPYAKLQVGEDIEGVARATVTATGVANAVRVSARKVADTYTRRQVKTRFSAATWQEVLGAPHVRAAIGLILATSVIFFTNSLKARLAVLATAVLVLGFTTGGFLSITHILNLFGGRPPTWTTDPGGVMFGIFAGVTSVVWGRVYCGFLCPFGALTEMMQNLVEKVWPRRWRLSGAQQKVLNRLHILFFPLKYLILLFLVAAVFIWPHVELAPYFEPFGTVFYRSGDRWLWLIAGFLLVMSLFIRRFYCRYLCPLGAALGLLSLFPLSKIKRVEPCTRCRLCEHDCPVHAIRQEKIIAMECHRCNICEVNLDDQRGQCRPPVVRKSQVIPADLPVIGEIAVTGDGTGGAAPATGGGGQ